MTKFGKYRTFEITGKSQEARSPGTKLKFKESNEPGQPKEGAGSCRVHWFVM